MSFIKRLFGEFREFAIRGSVVDLAVGIIIGTAFTGVVNSLVNDIIMPPIGYLLGGVDFTSFYVNLGPEEFDSLEAAQAAGAPTINYGMFINAVISFLIVAWVVFLLVKFINRLRREQEGEAEPTPSTRPCPYCAKEVSRKARRCPFCTAEIEPMEQPVGSTPAG